MGRKGNGGVRWAAIGNSTPLGAPIRPFFPAGRSFEHLFRVLVRRPTVFLRGWRHVCLTS